MKPVLFIWCITSREYVVTIVLRPGNPKIQTRAFLPLPCPQTARSRSCRPSCSHCFRNSRSERGIFTAAEFCLRSKLTMTEKLLDVTEKAVGCQRSVIEGLCTGCDNWSRIFLENTVCTQTDSKRIAFSHFKFQFTFHKVFDISFYFLL